VSSGYDFVRAQRGDRAWEDIRSVVDLTQISRIGLNFNSVHDPYNKGRFKSFNVTGGYGLSGLLPGGSPTAPQAPEEEDLDEELEARGPIPREGIEGAVRRASGSREEALNWTAGFSFSYGGTRGFDGELDPTASLNARATVNLTRNWSLSYDNRWDLSEGRILGENLSLKRDLHCWEAQFSRSRLGDDTSFYFRINVKKLSDVKYELGRRGGTGLSSISSLLP
jgi:hypothetical protein